MLLWDVVEVFMVLRLYLGHVYVNVNYQRPRFCRAYNVRELLSTLLLPIRECNQVTVATAILAKRSCHISDTIQLNYIFPAD